MTTSLSSKAIKSWIDKLTKLLLSKRKVIKMYVFEAGLDVYIWYKISVVISFIILHERRIS